jgi:hypothetical protein
MVAYVRKAHVPLRLGVVWPSPRRIRSAVTSLILPAAAPPVRPAVSLRALPSFSRAVALVLLLLAGGCSDDGPERPQPTASVLIPADPLATDDVPGTVACQALAAAVRDATLMEPGVVDAVAAAAVTADAPIADAGERLATAYAAAAAAQGTDREPDAVAAVSAVGAEMEEVCQESGLETVG